MLKGKGVGKHFVVLDKIIKIINLKAPELFCILGAPIII